MKSVNIITSLVVDPKDSSFNAQLYYLSHRKKREIYWKCCVTFFATSIRQNPNANHILFTNDKNEIVINNISIKDFLRNLNVQTIELSFEKFKPPRNYCKHYKLMLYILDVYYFLGKGKDEFNVCADSDCIWINPYPEISEFVGDDKLIIYDVYKMVDPLEKMHGINRKDLGWLYNKIDSNYPIADPIWYGGEFVAGGSNSFKKLSYELEHYFEFVIENFHAIPKLPNKKNILAGDELLLSLVLNKLTLKKVEVSPIFKRIWVDLRTNENNLKGENIFELAVWHMIGEKLYGIPLLCDKILDLNSEFWKLKKDELGQYLGLYFGFPVRKYLPKIKSNFKTVVPKIFSKAKELIHS